MNARLVLMFAGLFGFLISLYFSLVFYRRIRADLSFIPRVCRMDDATCQYVVHTPEARLFGIPNSLLGMMYYALITHTAIFSSIVHTELLFQIATVVTIGVALLSAYLVFALIIKLKTNCVLCFTSHGLNFLILLVLLSIIF